MSIRQFSGRFFLRDRTIRLKIGGPVSEDGQQTVIAMDETNNLIRIIRCDVEAYSFSELANLVREEFLQASQAGTQPGQPASALQH